jgi:hypothetical protein
VIPALLAAPAGTLAVVVTQTQPPAPGANRGDEFGSSSPIALVVILLLGIATAFLIRSMNKRLRNVPASFDPPEEPAPPDGPDGPDAPEPPPEGSTTTGAAGENGASRGRPTPER